MPDFIYTLMQFLPTLLVILAIVLSMIRGLMRGFRKSTILFINYLIAFVIGLVLFMSLTSKLYQTDISALVPTIGNAIGVDLSGAKYINDVIKLIVEAKATDYAGLVSNGNIEEVINCFTGLAVNLVGGIAFLIVIPFLVRTILYIVYLIFFREGRKKKNKIEEGEEYHRHRLGGMLIGVVRGLTTAILGLSILSSIYFISAGGAYYKNSSEADKTAFLDSISAPGVDLAKAYNAIKLSRNSGVGLIFDAIKIGGEPIDYYINDLIMTSYANSYKLDKNGKPLKVKVNFRKETANIIGMLEEILESGAFETKEEDGKTTVKFHADVLESKLDEDGNETNEVLINLANKIKASTLLSDIVPMAVIGISEAINDGSFKVDDSLKSYFTDDLIVELKQLDFANDFAQIFIASAKCLSLAPFDDNGKLDTKIFSDIKSILNYLSNLDGQMLSAICDDLSQVTLITKAIAPIFVTTLCKNMEEKLTDLDVEVLADGGSTKPHITLRLTDVDWAKEIKNLGPIITGFGEIGLDYNELFATDENGKSLALDYIIQISKKNDKADANGKHISDRLAEWVGSLIGYEGSTDGSYLFGELGVAATKYGLSKIKLQDSDTVTIYDRLKTSLDKYDAKMLRSDLQEVFTSCLSVVPLYQTFSGITAEKNYLKIIKELPLENVKSALVGKEDTDGNYHGGIYDLNLFKGQDKNGNEVNLLDGLLSDFLKGIGGIIKEEDIAKVSNWHTELIALVDTIEALQSIEGIENIKFDNTLLDTFPEINDSSVDSLTEALSQSILASGIISSTLIDTLDSIEDIQNKDDMGNVISWKDDTNIVWNDEKKADGTYNHGEINALLKAMSIVTRKDASGNKVVDLKNPIPGLVKLDREDADKVTNSYILKKVIKSTITTISIGDDDSVKLIVPNDIKWENSYDSDGNLVTEGELWRLMKVLKLNIFKATDDNGNETIDFSKLGKINELKNLTEEDVNTLTDSVIIKANLSNVTEKLLKTNNELEITMPDDIVWENTYDESGALKAKGELWALVDVLNIEALKKTNASGEEEVDFNALSDLNNLKKLTTSGEDNDMDKLFASKIIGENIGKLASKAVSDTLDEEIDDISDWKTELTSLIEITKLDEISDGNDGVDISKLSDIDTLASLIKRDSENNLNYDDTTKFAKSNIIMRAIAKKISAIGNDEMEIIVPTSYQGKENAEKWAHKDNDYTKGEFTHLVEVLFFAKASLSSDLSVTLTNDNLIEGIIKMQDHAHITTSIVMYATISNHLIKESNKETPTILVREEAKVSNPSENNNIAIKTSEINQVFDTLRDLDVIDIANIKINVLIDSLGDEEIRKEIRESNILNITILDKVVSNDALVIPNDLKKTNKADLNNSAWYPTKDSNGELDKILIAVSELNGKAITISDNDEITVDNDKILEMLSEGDSINKIYTSAVFATTISNYILTNNEVIVPMSYKQNNEAEATTLVENKLGSDILIQEEIQNLSQAFKALNITFDDNYQGNDKTKVTDLNINNLLNLKDEEIETVTASYIIAAKISSVMANVSSLTIPASVKQNYYNYNEQTNPEKGVYNDDICALIKASKHLDLNPEETTTFNLGAIDVSILNEELGNSLILHATMSDQIINNLPETTKVTETYHPEATKEISLFASLEASDTTKYLTTEEICNMVTALKSLGIADASDTSSINEESLSGLNGEQIKALCASGIIASIISDYLTACEIPDDSRVRNYESVYNSETTQMVVVGSELIGFLTGLNDLGISNTSDISNLDITEIETTNLTEILTNSKILQATLSVKVGENVTIPEYDVDNKAVKEAIGSKDYATTLELVNIINGFKSLGLNFDKLNAGDLGAVSIAKLNDNKDELLKSATIHALMSNVLIDQNIVGVKYPTAYDRSNDEFNYNNDLVITRETTKYVSKVEVEQVIDLLNALGVSANDTDAIGIETIGRLIDKQIEQIETSAILATIFSKVLIENTVNVPPLGSYAYYEIIGDQLHGARDYYKYAEVTNANQESAELVKIFALSDIAQMINEVKTYQSTL